jgi:hypothetical protein
VVHVGCPSQAMGVDFQNFRGCSGFHYKFNQQTISKDWKHSRWQKVGTRNKRSGTTLRLLTSTLLNTNNLVFILVAQVGLCLWTVTSSGPIVHSTDDIYECQVQVEWYWQGKPKNSEKNLSQCHFVHPKSRMYLPSCEPTPWQWKASDWLAEPWHCQESLVGTKLTAYKSTVSTTYKKCGGGKHYENL